MPNLIVQRAENHCCFYEATTATVRAEKGNVFSRMTREAAMNRLQELGASEEELERVRRSPARTGTAVATVT